MRSDYAYNVLYRLFLDCLGYILCFLSLATIGLVIVLDIEPHALDMESRCTISRWLLMCITFGLWH